MHETLVLRKKIARYRERCKILCFKNDTKNDKNGVLKIQTHFVSDLSYLEWLLTRNSPNKVTKSSNER